MVPERSGSRIHRALRETPAGGHLCAIYEDGAEGVAVAAASVRVGLERGECCLLVADPRTCDSVFASLRSEGVDVTGARRSGALLPGSAHGSLLREASFDAAASIEDLARHADGAAAAGFTGLRVTSDMSWQLGGWPGGDPLAEYEGALHGLFHERAGAAVCAYDARFFPAEATLMAVRSHPTVVYGGTFCHNPYYLPPADRMEPGYAEREVRRVLHGLLDRERSEAQLAYQVSLLANVTDAVIATDERLRLTSWNHAAEALFGWKADDVLGMPAEKVVRPLFSGVARADALATLQESGRLEIEVTAHRKDGSPVHTQVRVLALRTDDGRTTGYAAAVSDLTARRQAETSLRETEARMAVIVETAMDGIISVNQNQDIVLMNPAAEKMFGYDAADLLGRPLEILIPEPFRGGHATHVHRFGRTGVTARRAGELGSVSGIRADGEVFPLEVSISQATVGGARLFTAILRDITKRRAAESRIQKQLAQLDALRTIDTAISSGFDIRPTLAIILDQVTSLLEVDAADILLLQPASRSLEYAASRGFRTAAMRQARVRLGEGFAGRAALERHVVLVSDVADVGGDVARIAEMRNEEFVTYIATPLIAKGHVRGVLETFHRSRLEPDDDWLEFFNTLAGQTAIAIDGIQMFEHLQRTNLDLALAYDVTLEGWSRAMDLRDRETEGHTRRVTELTLRIARRMGLSDDELAHIRRGALLHDVGKLGIPDSILLKPDKLTDEEWNVMRRHPAYAYEWLSPIAYLRPALSIPYCHHEKWDGSGYPRGLEGEKIPLAARIFAVVDVFDALTSDRPYRKRWETDDALDHIARDAGRHFDPDVVRAFLADVGETRQAN